MIGDSHFSCVQYHSIPMYLWEFLNIFTISKYISVYQTVCEKAENKNLPVVVSYLASWLHISNPLKILSIILTTV